MSGIRQRRAFTLVEAVVGAIILAVIMLIVTQLFSSSMRNSMKGTSHLNNIQAAALLMGGLEHDIRRAHELQIGNGRIQVKFWDDIRRGAFVPETVVFRENPGDMGLTREAGAETHVFCQGLLVEPVGTGTPMFALAPFAGGKQGVLIRMRISSPKRTEPFDIERVVYCENTASNSPLPEWQPGDIGK